MRLLNPENYDKVTDMLSKIPFNTLFAYTVVGGTLPGKVFASESGETFLVVHPYGMSLLLGNPGDRQFSRELAEYMMNTGKHRAGNEWMQVHPAEWVAVIRDILGPNLVPMARDGTAQADIPDKVIELERVNFKFKRNKFSSPGQPPTGTILRTTEEMFGAIQGQVVPGRFWRDAKQFADMGAGFSLVIDGKPVSTAFSAFVKGNQLELGIETEKGHRGKGYAEHVCAALIGYCLDNALEPIWSCRHDNEGSVKLALKLGFEPSVRIPYYRLAL